MKRILPILAAGLIACGSKAQNPAADQAALDALTAAPTAPISPLDQVATSVTFTKKQALADAFYAIGRSYGLAFVVEPDVSGTAELDVPPGSTVRQVIDALVYPADLYYEVDGNRVTVRRTQTVFYQLFVPGNTRTSSSQTNITLTSSSQGSLNSQNNGGAGGAIAANGMNTTSGQSNGGSSNVSISEKNENPFWDLLKADLQIYLHKDEKATINPNSGLLVIDAGPRRQKFFRQFVANQNEILTRQVDIDAQILSVDVNDQHKLGVDLNLATVKAGGVTINGASTATGIQTVGPETLSANTFSASLTAGKISALISALQEQGEVRSVAKPQVRVMNNQMAYLVVGQEEGFFTLSATQQIQTGTGQNPTGTESAVYSKETLTFGTIFSVTANIPGPDTVILDVKPERSSLVRTKTSPDGRQESAVTNVEKAGTRLMLTDGETVVLAGLSSTSKGTKSRGVPGLSKIPILGRAFRTDASSNTKSELVIIITARITKPGQGSAIAQAK